MRYPANVVLFGVRLYTEFYLSSEECSRLIQDVMNTKVTGRTILNWVQKLAPFFQKISRLYRPHYSKIFLDEHRQVISTYLSDRRDSQSMIKTFKMAIDEAGFYPAIISTDKCKIYDMLRRYRKTRHVHAHFQTKLTPYGSGVVMINQNRIERYHFEVHSKEVRMRGIKNFECGTRFFQIRGVVHNYLRKHLTLGMTPAQYSGVAEDISWDNLAEILEVSAQIS